MVRSRIVLLSLVLVLFPLESLRAQDTSGAGGINLLDQTATDPGLAGPAVQGTPLQGSSPSSNGIGAASSGPWGGQAPTAAMGEAGPAARWGGPPLSQTVSPAVAAVPGMQQH